MKRALVTGGSGFLGGRLIEMLVARGVEVVALARSEVAARKVAARGAKPITGDLADGPCLPAALTGVDTVFHAAAHLHFWGQWADFVAAHVTATTRLVHAARQAGVARFVLVSAASVVMREPGPLLAIDETAPLTARRDLRYSATKAMAERAALAATTEAMKIVAVRPPLIWGPGDTFDRELGDRIRAGRFAYFDGARYPYGVCHVDNAAHGAILAAESGQGGEAYFLADDEITDARAFLDARIEAAGLVPPRRSVPSRMAWALAGAMETAWGILPLPGEPPLTREVVRLMGYPFTLKLDKAKDQLGYRPVIGRVQGLASLRSPRSHVEPGGATAPSHA